MAVRSTDGRAVLFACPPLGVCRTAAGLEGRSWPLPACAMRWPQAAVLAAGPATTLTAATLVTATLTATAYADAAAHADHAFATLTSEPRAVAALCRPGARGAGEKAERAAGGHAGGRRVLAGTAAGSGTLARGARGCCVRSGVCAWTISTGILHFFVR